MSNVMEWARKVQDKRSERAKRMDAERRATNTFENPTVGEYRLWKKAPGRYDIVGIDTPEQKVRKSAPKKVTTEPKATKAEPEVNRPVPEYEPDDWEKGKRRKTKKVKSDARGYSSSWYSKLKFREDPVGASRLAAKAMAAEQIEDLDDARAYLEDTRYDEIDHKTHRTDMEAAMAIIDKMHDDYRMYEMEMMSSPDPGASVVRLELAERTATLLETNAPYGFEAAWRSHVKAVRDLDRYLGCPGTAEDVARLVTTVGGKGSRTLAKDIRQWIADGN